MGCNFNMYGKYKIFKLDCLSPSLNVYLGIQRRISNIFFLVSDFKTSAKFCRRDSRKIVETIKFAEYSHTSNCGYLLCDTRNRNIGHNQSQFKTK